MEALHLKYLLRVLKFIKLTVNHVVYFDEVQWGIYKVICWKYIKP